MTAMASTGEEGPARDAPIRPPWSSRAMLSGVLRTVLQRASRRVVLRRRLPRRLGGHVVYISPDAILSSWRSKLEDIGQARLLFDWARRYVRPGDVVWDIGSNQGLFTFAAAHQCGPTGRVIAVEPDVFLVDLVQRSVRNLPDGFAQISVVPAAVGDEVGLGRLRVANASRALNHLDGVEGNPRTRGARQVSHVVLITLDWLRERVPPPDVIKIDTEGADLLVLQGGAELIREYRPRIIVETAPQLEREITSFFAAFGYQLFDAENGRPISQAAWNTYAEPEGGRKRRA